MRVPEFFARPRRRSWARQGVRGRVEDEDTTAGFGRRGFGVGKCERVMKGFGAGMYLGYDYRRNWERSQRRRVNAKLTRIEVVMGK
jgi:hypothetical protein